MIKEFKKLLSITLTASLFIQTVGIGFMPVSKVYATTVSPALSLNIKNKLDVALSVGTTTADVSTFEQDLRAALVARGVATDNVNILAVKESQVSVASGAFNWWTYDHYNTNSASSGNPRSAPTDPGYPPNVDGTGKRDLTKPLSDPPYTGTLIDDTTHQYAEGYLENNNNFNLNRHIIVEDNGQTMTMNGYGSPGYKDFMYMPNTESTKKTFEFKVQELAAFDALDGGGFLFNTTITGNYGSGQTMSGYLVFLKYNGSGKGSAINLYKFENIDTKAFHAGTVNVGGAGFTSLATSSNYLSTDTWRNIKIEAYPSKVKMWYKGSTAEDSSVLSDSQLINWTIAAGGTGTTVTLPAYAATKSYGFGPMISYNSHNCARPTQFKFKSLTMSTDKVKSLTEVVREPEWSDSSQKFIVNLNEDPITDFTDPQKVSELISRLNIENTSYVGWGSDTNKVQTNTFLQQNGDKGTFVNINDAATDTYQKQIDAIATYIVTKYNTVIGNGDAYVLTSDNIGFTANVPLVNTIDGTWPQGRWKVVHDITGFDNANGLFEYNNQSISDLNLTFSKPGKYDVYYEGSLIRTIYAHEKPIASFSATTNSGTSVSYTDSSYDPDKKNQSGNGIVARQWSYMDVTTGGAIWIPGQLTTVEANKTYLISLTVQDGFGQWSNSYTRELYTGASTIKPIADFRLASTSLAVGKSVGIEDNSYDPSGAAISGYNWTVTKDGTSYPKSVSLSNIDFTGDGPGTYVVSLTVVSTGGTSEIVSRTLTIQDAKYTITFNSQGGSTVAPITNITSGASITLPTNPTKTGYTFAGWNTASNGTGAAITVNTVVNADATVYAQWIALPTHIVTFNSNGGSVVPQATVTSGAAITLPTNPTKTGYIFAGWNTSSNGTGAAITVNTVVNADATVYAQWIAVPTHIVTFNSNGGSVVPQATVTSGAAITLPTNPTKPGYIFAGWNTASNGTGAAITVNTVVTADTTVYAQWTVIVPGTYTITFDSNGGSVVIPVSITSGAAITLPTNPTKTGYTFAGWNTASNGTGAAITVNTVVTANATVYAQWIAIVPTIYTITFDSNGGSVVSPVSITAGATITLPTNPTKTGYTFAGWNTASNGAGTAITVNTIVTADATVYAQWVAIAPVTYTLTYTAGTNGSITGTKSQTVNSGASAAAVTAVPNAGYYFVSWSDGVTTATRTDSNVTANISVTAIFAETVYASDGGSSTTATISTPTTVAESTTIKANVIDESGQSVKALQAQVATEADGTKTVTMKSTDAIVMKQSDGTKSTLTELSKLGFSTPITSGGTEKAVSVTMATDGTIQIKGLSNNTESKFSVTYDLGNGQRIIIGVMDIKVGSNGEVTLTSTLIDPYGIITDEATGKAIDGVNMVLYYADTERNKAAGKTPNTVVQLPSIDGFKPNNNKNPQVSDANGAYGFMVFPTSDYYLVGTKDGYIQYTSPIISVEQEIVKWNIKMHITGAERLFGENRVDTALAIAKATYFNTIPNVILATSENYPDALAGSVLGYKLNAPIILVGSSEVEQDKVLAYLKDNMDPAGKVYILGGTGAVNQEIETKVTGNGFKNISRLGGADRYETAVKIADTIGVKEGTPIVVVSGENYADALSISSIAAANQYPIFLVSKDGILDVVKNEISAIKPSKVFIIGLQGAVSPAIEAQVAQTVGVDKGSIIRVGGTDRYNTSLEVSQYFNLSGNIACVATGNDFPDALAGSIYAAENNASIILVDKALTDDEMTYLQNGKIAGWTIFGGEGIISNDIMQQLNNVSTK